MLRFAFCCIFVLLFSSCDGFRELPNDLEVITFLDMPKDVQVTVSVSTDSSIVVPTLYTFENDSPKDDAINVQTNTKTSQVRARVQIKDSKSTGGSSRAHGTTGGRSTTGQGVSSRSGRSTTGHETDSE